MGWFTHIMKHLIGNMLRCNTKLATDMVFDKLLHKYRTLVCNYIVKTYTGPDKDLLDTWYLAEFTKQRNIIRVIYLKISAWFREKTLTVLTDTFS